MYLLITVTIIRLSRKSIEIKLNDLQKLPQIRTISQKNNDERRLRRVRQLDELTIIPRMPQGSPIIFSNRFSGLTIGIN